MLRFVEVLRKAVLGETEDNISIHTSLSSSSASHTPTQQPSSPTHTPVPASSSPSLAPHTEQDEEEGDGAGQWGGADPTSGDTSTERDNIDSNSLVESYNSS